MFFKKKAQDFLNETIDKSEIIENLFVKIYNMEKIAVKMAISYIANAISNSEFKFYENKKIIKNDFYYRLNVSANPNQNSTQFWQKAITNMILDGEALAFTNKDYVYIADSYNPIKEDLKGNRYENISLAFSDKYFDKNFDEVFLFRIDSMDFVKILLTVLNNYGYVFSESCNDLLSANAERWIYEADNLEHGDKDFNEKWRKRISTKLKEFLESRRGLYPKNSGSKIFQLETKQKNISAGDIVNIRKDIFEIVANVFKMPISMFTGNINNMNDVVSTFLTFCVDPIADMLGQEVTRKLYSEEQYFEGCLCKVDTSCITHYDLFGISDKADRLIASGVTDIDEIRTKVNLEELNTSWSKQHYFTKNYGKIEDVLKGGGDNEK
ncbi:phage portal protein [uncultured Clostridium sp.]|uniref:phage portal protein n=1 Tax=uncultured Clostridium sp. TaxID=59620 RepID=UPI0026085389|nr:phage portal protein [uncultured Clostridium sp.]